MNNKTIQLIPNETPDKYLEMPEGLDGYWWETENLVCVPFVEAYKAGAFSSFLKELDTRGKIIFFPTIISAKLNAILRSKGYVDAGIQDGLMGFVDGLANSYVQLGRGMREPSKFANLIDRVLDFGSNETYSHFKEFLYHTVNDAYHCPVKSWIPGVWMTIKIIPKFILATIREWRMVTKFLEWEIWIPDYDEERERFFKGRR